MRYKKNNHFLIKDTLKMIDEVPCASGVYYVVNKDSIHLSAKDSKYVKRKYNRETKKNKPIRIDKKRESVLQKEVLYIGSTNNLNRRLFEFYCFLYCKGNRHCGGKAIGQINQIDSLYFLYKKEKKFRYTETAELFRYKSKKEYGRVPFANRYVTNKHLIKGEKNG